MAPTAALLSRSCTAAPAESHLSGVAATGAAIAGRTVTATSASGPSASATTAADGSYAIDIGGAGPFVLSVTDLSGKQWLLYAPVAGVANINPLTTLALLDANANKPLTALVANWSTSTLPQDAVAASAKKVNANLATQMRARGVDPANANVFADAFTANHAGMDAVLDSIRVAYSCAATACSFTITTATNGAPIVWSGAVATTGINFSWTGSTAATAAAATPAGVSVGASCSANQVPGTYSMVVQGTVTTASTGTVTSPEVCIDGLTADEVPTSQAEFCDPQGFADSRVQVISCSFANSVGRISATVTSPAVAQVAQTITFLKH